MSGVARLSLALLLVVLLAIQAACRQDEYAVADNRILYTKEGCAFYVSPGLGATSFLDRVPESDLESCTEKP